jgi:hypothetical protein
MKNRPLARGSALLTVVALTSILLLLVIGVLAYSASSRRRTISAGRGLIEQSCAAAGLQLARAYFGQRHDSWGTYLSNPEIYNPIGWTSDPDKHSEPYAPPTAHDDVKAKVRKMMEDPSTSGLFFDIDNDSDNVRDVYIYCRDNADERPPATNDWNTDNDNAIIVGAMCINDRLRARRPDGTLDDDLQTAEALLKWERPVAGTGGKIGTQLNDEGEVVVDASPGLGNATGGAGASGTGNGN